MFVCRMSWLLVVKAVDDAGEKNAQCFAQLSGAVQPLPVRTSRIIYSWLPSVPRKADSAKRRALGDGA